MPALFTHLNGKLMPFKKVCCHLLTAAFILGCIGFAKIAAAQGTEPADKMDAFSQNMGKIVGIAIIAILILYAIKSVASKGKKKDTTTNAKKPEAKP